VESLKLYEVFDLLFLPLRSIKNDDILGFSLPKCELKGYTVQPCLEWYVANAALHRHLNRLPIVDLPVVQELF